MINTQKKNYIQKFYFRILKRHDQQTTNQWVQNPKKHRQTSFKLRFHLHSWFLETVFFPDVWPHHPTSSFYLAVYNVDFAVASKTNKYEHT